MDTAGRTPLVPLGEGAYSVAQVCRILQPTMTARKVHYWLDTGLLSPSIVHGSRGTPTLLTFQQLLEIRTTQRLRDELHYSLSKVRDAFGWILQHLFSPDWRDLRFERGVGGALVVQHAHEELTIPGGQGVLPDTITELNRDVRDTTGEAWEARRYRISEHLVADAHILGGAPVISGTRIEPSLLASFAENSVIDIETFRAVKKMFRHVETDALVEALQFEGVTVAAA